MWRYCKIIDDAVLAQFESAFRFRINAPLRQFLLVHNGGIPTPGLFPTSVRERKMAMLFDFSNLDDNCGAWAVNSRLRDKIGPKRIVIGKDVLDNLICVEREQRQQRIVVWNHIKDVYESCPMEIPVFLHQLG